MMGTEYASDIGTGRVIISDGEVKMLQGTYSPIPIRL